ncbi:MAG: histidine kinase N-terminal 7TM domain-containing protein [Erysipelotrichaceae bacterium]|nr:histidine kinase N-terminal 7TM domain-containing protein [Erysipelotrichaceae bacterium]
MIKQNRNTWLFLAFLLLGGITYLFTRTHISMVDTFMFSANFMIYIGLLISWMQSVRDRLLPTRARSYILTSALLMIFYLLVRILRFRILTQVVIRRYVDYAYNIPMVLVPTLFLMTCILISRGEEAEGKGKEWLLLFPACGMLMMIMSNDIHQLFYHRLIPLSEFHGIVGTYTYGPLFYLMYVWMAVIMITGFVILIHRTYRQNVRALIWFVCVTFIWVGLSLINWLVFTPLNMLRMYHSPEIQVFGMLGSFEVCIRYRLIPYNENYTGFFSSLGLPVRITDEAFRTVYETNIPIKAEDAELFSAIKNPVYLDEDTRLLGMKLHPGYVFWTEDERELHEEGRRLAVANELLSEENDLIAVENELKERKAHLEAQDQVYDRIASALYPKQKRIEELLESTSSESDSFLAVLAECCVLNAYCKRKCNLLLLSEDNLPHPNRELFLALQESARFLKCCGIDAAAIGEEYSEFPLTAIHDLYDSFETLIEALLPVMRRMTVSLSSGGIRIAAETDTVPPLPETSLPVVCRESDGCLFLTLTAAKGGDAR